MKRIKPEIFVPILICCGVASVVLAVWFTMFHTRILPVDLQSRPGVISMHSSRYVSGYPGSLSIIVLAENVSDSRINYAIMTWTAVDNKGVVISAGWDNSLPPLDPGQFGEVHLRIYDMPSEAVKLRLYFSSVMSGGRAL